MSQLINNGYAIDVNTEWWKIRLAMKYVFNDKLKSGQISTKFYAVSTYSKMCYICIYIFMFYVCYICA